MYEICGTRKKAKRCVNAANATAEISWCNGASGDEREASSEYDLKLNFANNLTNYYC